MTTSIVTRGLDQLGALLDAVTPDDVGRATPCSEWTVADLSDHIVNSTAGMAIMGEVASPTGPPPPITTTRPRRWTARPLAGRALDPVAPRPEGMAAAELAVHTYDLATALGMTTADLDPKVAEEGLAFMTSSMTDEIRGDAFGPEQPAPTDADAYQRIAAFAGRTV